MTYTFDGFNYIIRLSKGEHLTESLNQFVAATHTHGLWMSGLGSAQEVTVGFFDLATKKYTWQTYTGAYEINSLQGNLALDESGAGMHHLHGTFSDASFQVIGGHVKDLVVGGTLELFAHRTYTPLKRKTDKETGLQLLDLGKS